MLTCVAVIVTIISKGFEKCGTTTLLDTLHYHDEVFMGHNSNEKPQEIRFLNRAKVEMFKELYEHHIGRTASNGKIILNG